MLVNNWDIHYFDEVESTNLIVKDKIRESSMVAMNVFPAIAMAAMDVRGFVAVAKKQTGGKGMRGHSWCSPKGGLYFSLLLEPTLPPEKLSEIPLRIATVVMEALQPLSTEPITIKPPNDIVLARSAPEHPSRIIRASRSQNSLQDTLLPTYLSTYSVNKSSEGNNYEGLTAVNRSATSGPYKVKKLVGISTELYMEKLCVGIGINVFHPEEEFQVEGLNQPVYLEDFSTRELTLDFVLKTVLNALNAKLEI